MLVQSFGTTSAAFGLEWIGSTASLDDAFRALAESRGGSLTQLQKYTAVPEPEDVTVGICLAKTKLPRGTISAAQALAKTHSDGIFVLPLKVGIEDQIWYCVVRNHSVVAKTDIVLQGNWLKHVNALCRTIALPVFAPASITEAYADDPDALFLKSARELDVAALLSDGASPALKRASSFPVGIVALIAVALLAIGGMFYFANSEPQQASGPSPEEIRKQRIQAFVSGAARDIEPYPASGRWAVDAMSLAQANFPPFLAGWALSEVVCDPSKCEGLYKRSDVGGYSLTPLIERFGADHVAMTDTTRAVKASFALETEMVDVSEAWLRSLKPESVLFADWLGRIPDTMDEVAVSGQAYKARLDLKYKTSDLGFPEVTVEKVRFGSRHFLDIVTLYSLLQIGEQDRFRPTLLHWLPGTDGKRPSWVINWSRVHG